MVGLPLGLGIWLVVASVLVLGLFKRLCIQGHYKRYANVFSFRRCFFCGLDR